ncbi:hypothetical protein K474DRAFT_1499114 [Panus rudis PR-1116 ss-1]|nr:hypothetical protein K474DRAFT_1499114 [Panus rudis PR-1116 ss-1]
MVREVLSFCLVSTIYLIMTYSRIVPPLKGENAARVLLFLFIMDEYRQKPEVIARLLSYSLKTASALEFDSQTRLVRDILAIDGDGTSKAVYALTCVLARKDTINHSLHCTLYFLYIFWATELQRVQRQTGPNPLTATIRAMQRQTCCGSSEYRSITFGLAVKIIE